MNRIVTCSKTALRVGAQARAVRGAAAVVHVIAAWPVIADEPDDPTCGLNDSTPCITRLSVK